VLLSFVTTYYIQQSVVCNRHTYVCHNVQERTHTMSVMNTFALEAAANDVVHNPIVINITFAEGECEPMTVTTRSGEYTMVHVQDVSVQFSGRSFAKLSNVSGWLFVSKCGRYSDMLLNADAFGTTPEWVAREWIKSNNQIVTFKTTVTIK